MFIQVKQDGKPRTLNSKYIIKIEPQIDWVGDANGTFIRYARTSMTVDEDYNTVLGKLGLTQEDQPF